MKLSTLCFLLKDDRILLAMKKRGFGEGKWNGAGGKVKDGESVERAAVREMEEEIGVAAAESDLEPRGVLRFRSSYNEALNWDVHVFIARAWEGEPQESEEMRPQWFDVDRLPFDVMWPDDRHWFPYLLAGKKIEAEFSFNEAADDFVDFSIKEI